MKIDCQLIASVIRPPTTGPIADPATPAAAHRRGAPALVVRGRDEELEAGRDHERAADRLRDARDDEDLERAGERAAGRCRRERDEPDRARVARAPARADPRGGHRGQREHQVEARQDPRDLRTPRRRTRAGCSATRA